MVIETKSGPEGGSTDSSILRNPAVIFDEIGKVRDRYNEADYEDVHRQFVEWINDQWGDVREATQKL